MSETGKEAGHGRMEKYENASVDHRTICSGMCNHDVGKGAQSLCRCLDPNVLLPHACDPRNAVPIKRTQYCKIDRGSPGAQL